MSDDEKSAIALGMVIGFAIGMVLMVWLVTTRWENMAIKNNAAHYHPTTGDFTWNTTPEKLEEK